MERNAVKVRFAPSPTGMLHLGGARTALFNYLFARYHGGKFILRVEDTDRVRSSEEFERLQLEDLQWLGLRFDEGPYRQSERGGFYEEAAGRLLEAGLAYEAGDEAGRRALYFRPSVRSGIFRDALRGEIRFVGVEDFVIFKSDGSPAYNFAAVVDDATMRISHVIGVRSISRIPPARPSFTGLSLFWSPNSSTSAWSWAPTARSSLNVMARRASRSTGGKDTCLRHCRAISLYLAGRTRRARRSLRTLTSSRENGTHRASARAPLPSTPTASSSLMPDTSGRCHSESCTSASCLSWRNHCPRDGSYSRSRRSETRCVCSRRRHVSCARSWAR